MEARMRKYAVQASPERSKPAQKQASRRIPVVYYLCRNHHLEHPHFIEVPTSSSDGLYLRDVIKRLIELRGKRMPSIYSWSCKRSYKNGFVWHDLSDDDAILPVHGNEYVLKGSELLDQTPPDRTHHSTSNPLSQSLPQSETPTFPKTSQASSSSFPTSVIKESKTPPLPPPPPNQEENWDYCSPSTSEFGVYKPANASDASTQTDENGKSKSGEKAHNTFNRGVSADNGFPSPSSEIKDVRHNRVLSNEISLAPDSSSASSSGEKIETLESLIRADARRMNRFRPLEEDEVYVHPGPRMRTTNILMQILTCGSLPIKNHGLVTAYNPRFSHMKFPTPMLAGSMVLGELDCLSECSKFTGMKIEDTEYFSSSFIEFKKHKEEAGEGVASLKRSSSFNADRNLKSPDSKPDNDKLEDSLRSKCLPRTIKISTPNRQYKNGMLRSPISDRPRVSSSTLDSSQLSQGGSERIVDNSSLKGSSTGLESFKELKEKVIKIEERLISGARVIIQSRTPCEESEGSSSS